MKNFKTILILFLLTSSIFIVSCENTCNLIVPCNEDCTLGDIEELDEKQCLCVVTTVVVNGCTDETANNYNPSANCDDGSCDFECLDPGTCNINCDLGDLEIWDASTCECIVNESALGCTDVSALNYDDTALCDDGSCIYTILGCTDPCSFNYDQLATEDDGTCICARDRFLGNYIGSFTCPDDPVLMVFNSDNFNIELVEGIIPEDKETVNFTFRSGVFTGLSLITTVCENRMTLPLTTLSNLPFDIGGNTITLDVEVSGDFVLNGDEFQGTFQMKFSTVEGATLGIDECEIQAIKQ